ncbi:MAG: tripartite tricarboxylate transporter permease [Syntrophomonadaceae bacterium]
MPGIEGLLLPFQHPETILFVALGVFIGIYAGALPGISISMTIAILISFTFPWPFWSAFGMMIGVYIGGIYGGSRAAILLNIPGVPAAVASTFDGYPMAQKGEAGQAMGLATSLCVFGTTFGVIILALFSPLIANIALKFTPMHFFWLGLMGILIISSLGGSNILKSLLCGVFGILLGCVGIDPFFAEARLTFGSEMLLSGFNFVVVMIALFGLAESLVQIRNNIFPVKQKIDRIIPEWKTIKKHLPLTLRSGVIGVLIGALPGTGGDIASLMAYEQAKRTVKNPTRPFGEGAVEGLVAAEAASSACIGGTMIPMLTLGIPGDAVTAILIGALMIHGLRPGPLLMVDQPEFFYVWLACLFFGVIFLWFFGMQGIRLFAKIVEIPKGMLVPIIIVFTFIGCFSIQNNFIDVYVMLIIGLLGYFMKMYGFEVAPTILGLILAPIIEENWRRSMQIMHNHISEFLVYTFTDTISLILVFILIVNAKLTRPKADGVA